MGDVNRTRRAARVLLLDGAGRLLLFRASDERGSDRVCWFAPGGGVEDGETLPQAAARELFEETGLSVAPDDLGPVVAHTEGGASFSWGSGYFVEDFFALRVGTHDVDVSGLQELERDLILGHRWWPVPELRSTGETVYPFALPDLLDDLLHGRAPATPVQLPWHHPGDVA